jgi:hypothetical protein
MKKYFINYIIILLFVLAFIINGCSDSGLTLVFMPSPTPGITEEIYNVEPVFDKLLDQSSYKK